MHCLQVFAAGRALMARLQRLPVSQFAAFMLTLMVYLYVAIPAFCHWVSHVPPGRSSSVLHEVNFTAAVH